MSHPKPLPKISTRDVERFWSKVNKRCPDECWSWTGGLGSGIRAVFWVCETTTYAARVMWFLQNGQDPGRLNVLHSCDNAACVNPRHLFLGTLKDNHDDMKEKGRRASFVGAKNSQAKLTDFDVKLMRALHFQNGASMRSIAIRFGVQPSVGQRAIQGDTWNHVKYLLKE